MLDINIQRVRDYLCLDTYEVSAPDKAILPGKRCTVKGNLSMWEQGQVCGYMVVRGEVHAVVTYSERPDEHDLPQFDIVRTDRVRPFRKIVEREFRL